MFSTGCGWLFTASPCVVWCGVVWFPTAVSAGDEQQIDRMYQMMDSHHKRSAAASALRQSSSRRDTRTDTQTGRLSASVLASIIARLRPTS